MGQRDVEQISTEAPAFHPELSPARRWAVLICFVFIAAVSIMGQLTMTTCLPQIIGEFGVSTETGQWLTTSYMLALGIMVPCSGFLTTRFQSRHIFLVAGLVFLCGLFGAVAPNFPSLVLVRVVQGLAAGIFVPLMQIVAFRLFEPQRRGFAMGIVAVALASGPALGPVVAGVCTDLWGWRSVFICVAVLTALALACYPVIRVLNDATEACPFDVPSLLALAVGFTGAIVGVSNLGLFGSDAPSALLTSALPLTIAVVTLGFFSRRQLRLTRPLLNLAPLFDMRFTMGAVVCMFLFGVLINTEVFMSVYIQNDQGYSASMAALCLLPGSVVSAVLSPFTGRYLDAHGPLALSAIGFAVLIVSGILASLVEMSSPLGYSIFAFVLRNIGNAFALQNLQTWSVNILPAEHMTHGTAIFNTLRQVGSALINSMLFVLMGAATPALGELGGIKLAFAVSTAVVALLGVWCMAVLVRAKGQTKQV